MTVSLIEKLKADMQARRQEVDVLGVKVYVTPLPIGEQLRINALNPDNRAAQMAEMIISRCRDAEGNPVFTRGDKDALRHEVAGDRVSALVAAITGPPVSEQAKN